FLGRSSLRITGVSFAKYQTIADSIGISKRTVIRAMNKLADFGMIDRMPTVKKWRRSVNIVRILTDLSPQGDTAGISDKTNTGMQGTGENEKEPIIINHFKDFNSINTYGTPYNRFKSAVKQFVGAGDKSIIYRLYGVYLAQTKDLCKAYEDTELIDVAIQGIYATFNASKSKTIRNIVVYYNGVISKMYDAMGSELMAELFVE